MIKIGQKVRFEPFRLMQGFCSNDRRLKNAKGEVIYINVPNRWFLVEYNISGKPVRTSFKFHQIGKDVRLCDG